MQLIQVTNRHINNQLVPTVNARELHQYLETRSKFAEWINRRINEYKFVENQDFVSFSEISEKPQTPENKGGRPTKEYYVTLNMAKELAMVERTEKGREARRYFINCEQEMLRLQAQQQAPRTGATNGQVNQLIRTLQQAIQGQEAIINKLISSHTRTQDLQAQTLSLLERQLNRRRYRPATNEDYFKVKDMLKDGKSFAYISASLDLSQHTIYSIKHGLLHLGNDGMLQKNEPKILKTTNIHIEQ